MLRQLHEIKGMQVVSLAEGRLLGTVLKVFLNPQKKAVSGFLIKLSGTGKQDGWVDISAIQKVGEDFLFVDKSVACKSKPPVGRSLKALMGMPVVSKDGKLLGSLVDVEIDANWQVIEVRLSDDRLIEIDTRQAVFGQDTILLKAGAATRIRNLKKKKVGFLARMFGTETIEEAADAISRAERTQIRSPDSSPKPRTKKPGAKKATKKKTKASR
jgi:sporulation protein YlmC with PRC-barrel domain